MRRKPARRRPRGLDPPASSALDAFDALREELDRLEGIVELMSCAGDTFPPTALPSVAMILRDVQGRMLAESRRLLAAAVRPRPKRADAGG